MYDTCSNDLKLETIEESSRHKPSSVATNHGSRRKRNDITRAERQTSMLWVRTPSFSKTIGDDSSSNSLEDFSSSSYGSYQIVETPIVEYLPSKGREKVSQKPKKSKKRPKKTVRFDCDEEGAVRCEFREYEKVRSTLHCDIWWTDDELASFRQACVDVVLEFKDNGEFSWAVSALYNSKGTSTEEFSLACKLYQQFFDARGLEIHIADVANVIVKKQQRVVLKKPRGDKELRRKSKYVTKHSKTFAIQIAQIDAILSFV